jgi:hypothetical protein
MLLLFCLSHFIQCKLFAFSGGIELGTKKIFREDSQHPCPRFKWGGNQKAAVMV